MGKNKEKPFFGRKICLGCKKPAQIFTCTGTGNKVYCESCYKKFLDQSFNGLAFKSLDVISKEQCQINIEKIKNTVE